MNAKLEEIRQEIDRLNRQSRYAELLPLVEQATIWTRQEYGEYSAEYAAALNELGGVYRAIGNYPQSLAAFTRALETAGLVFGVIDPNYATTVNNLAGLYRLMGELDKAEQFFRKAIAIYANTVGKTHFLYTSALNNLGLLYQQMERFSEAAELHEACLDLLRRGEPNPIACATTLNNLAQAYKKLGKTARVEGLLTEALQIYEHQFGREHALYAGALNNLAAYYAETGLDAEAKEYFLQAAGLCKKLFGESSRPYASTLVSLAIVCEKLGESDAARDYRISAAQLQKHWAEGDPRQINRGIEL